MFDNCNYPKNLIHGCLAIRNCMTGTTCKPIIGKIAVSGYITIYLCILNTKTLSLWIDVTYLCFMSAISCIPMWHFCMNRISWQHSSLLWQDSEAACTNATSLTGGSRGSKWQGGIAPHSVRVTISSVILLGKRLRESSQFTYLTLRSENIFFLFQDQILL